MFNVQSTPYKCYFSLSVTKILLPKILQRESVICYLLQYHTPFFVNKVPISVTFHLDA
jgi:hypothetical protein